MKRAGACASTFLPLPPSFSRVLPCSLGGVLPSYINFLLVAGVVGLIGFVLVNVKSSVRVGAKKRHVERGTRTSAEDEIQIYKQADRAKAVRRKQTSPVVKKSKKGAEDAASVN